jgi:hypothetical protein
MHFQNMDTKQSKKGGSIVMKKLSSVPRKMNGGAILANRMVGKISNPTSSPPQSTSMSMMTGGMMNFNKVKSKKQKDENIKFVY